MIHYVGFIWDPRDRTASSTVKRYGQALQHSNSGWTPLLAGDGMSVLAMSPPGRAWRTYLLPDGAGVVLGRLFPTALDQWYPQWQPQWTERDVSIWLNSHGSDFTQRYWGSFVAYFWDADHARALVLRDSSGQMPCYRLQSGNVSVFFSEITDLDCLDLPPLSINWRYVAAFIYSSQLQIRESGFINISEILAGECVEVRPEGTRAHFIWDPRRLCREPPITNVTCARVRLRTVTQGCIAAWASVFDRVLHSLSGGLDSAIVLGCLSRSTPRPAFACVNRYAVNPGEDERRFARLAAAMAGVELLEHPWYGAQRTFDSFILNAPRAVKPTIPAVASLIDMEFRNQLLSEFEAEALWTGQGGDHLFNDMRSELGAADFLSYHGIRLGLISAIADAARLSKQPYVAVLRAAWKLGRSTGRWRPYSRIRCQPYFVNADYLPPHPEEYVDHPWALEADDLPNGKQFQIQMLSELLHRHRPLPGVEYAREHHPLIAQPLMDLCMRIPTYLLAYGGRPRGLARVAFQEEVPPEILNRLQKGTTVSSVMDRVRRSARYLRELLLDGYLAREHLIDAKSLEPHLSSSQTLKLEQLFPLVACIAAEVWIRTWRGSRLSRAA